MRFFSPKQIPLALFLGAALTSCSTYRQTVAIHFSTDPPGADVCVNGVPSGFATPCMLALKREKQIITIEKVGYQTAARALFPDPKNATWFYSEASANVRTFDFPTHINLDDFFEPVQPIRQLIPGRIFVRLKRNTSADPDAGMTAEGTETE